MTYGRDVITQGTRLDYTTQELLLVLAVVRVAPWAAVVVMLLGDVRTAYPGAVAPLDLL